ncbi:MAG: adenine-specific DNA methylase [bacterium]
MIINRKWAMPNSETFSIKPIKELIDRFVVNKENICDPFVRNSPFKSICVSNDIDPDIDADFHMDALDFLKTRKDGEFDMVLFDPPYSSRQVVECYKKMGKSVNMETTQGSFWANLKKEIRRITSNDSIVISCGWNSGGIGEKYGFELEEILLVPHGGVHNDTIVTVENKKAINFNVDGIPFWE